MLEEQKMFDNYVESFDKMHAKVDLKYKHTYRVVSYALKIAKSLNLNEEDVIKAEICALFHDIGRFNQIKIFNNLDDDVSFDHGDEGYKVLKELNYNDEIVLLSTKYHNKYSVPEDLDERVKMFCNITRDADKLDILFTQYSKVSKNEIINNELFECIYNKKLVSNNLVTDSSEAMIRGLSFIFDINYHKTFEIINDAKLLDKKIDILLKNCNDDRIKDLKKFIDKYIEERLKIC